MSISEGGAVRDKFGENTMLAVETAIARSKTREAMWEDPAQLIDNDRRDRWSSDDDSEPVHTTEEDV
jgi:hypothetical protein